MTLEEILDELERYGEPKVVKLGGGWWSKCELNVRVKGASFDIDSECTHATPKAAAAECLERVRGCLRDIHKMAPQVPHKQPALEEAKY